MSSTIIDELRFSDSSGNTYTANMDRTNFVHLVGDENITGRKTFSDIPLVPNYDPEIHPKSAVINASTFENIIEDLKSSFVSVSDQYQEIPGEKSFDTVYVKDLQSNDISIKSSDKDQTDTYQGSIDFSNGDKTLAQLYNTYNLDSSISGIRVYNKYGSYDELYIKINNSGKALAYCPTPDQPEDSDAIATTKYVNLKLKNNYVPYYNTISTSTKISGGQDNDNATLELFSVNDTNSSGMFKLTSVTSESTYTLQSHDNGMLSWSGDFNANKVYSAVFNDYAEFFEKGEDVSEGDIIALIQDEKYGKATIDSKVVIGVFSKEPAIIVGGKKNLAPKEQSDFIPVALSGRVLVKVLEEPELGDYITTSTTPGVGKPIKFKDDHTVGQVVSKKDYKETGMVKIFVL